MITAKDLESATPEVQQGDIVVIVTGWHHKYADALEYYGESPGLTKDAAQWLVKKIVSSSAWIHLKSTTLWQHR